MNLTDMMKTTATIASAAVFAFCAEAQDDASAPAGDDVAATDGALAPVKTEDKFFYPLMRCRDLEGPVQVLRPRDSDWMDAEEGRYYPLGSIVRVMGDAKTKASVRFEFGTKSHVVASGDVEFATREIKIGDVARTLVLRKGRVDVKLPLQLKEGLPLKSLGRIFLIHHNPVWGEEDFRKIREMTAGTNITLAEDGMEICI